MCVVHRCSRPVSRRSAQGTNLQLASPQRTALPATTHLQLSSVTNELRLHTQGGGPGLVRTAGPLAGGGRAAVVWRHPSYSSARTIGACRSWLDWRRCTRSIPAARLPPAAVVWRMQHRQQRQLTPLRLCWRARMPPAPPSCSIHRVWQRHSHIQAASRHREVSSCSDRPTAVCGRIAAGGRRGRRQQPHLLQAAAVAAARLRKVSL